MPARKKTFRVPNTAAHAEVRLMVNSIMEDQAVLVHKATTLMQKLGSTPHTNTGETKQLVLNVIQCMEMCNQSIAALREKVLNG